MTDLGSLKEKLLNTDIGTPEVPDDFGDLSAEEQLKFQTDLQKSLTTGSRLQGMYHSVLSNEQSTNLRESQSMANLDANQREASDAVNGRQITQSNTANSKWEQVNGN